MRAGSEWPGHVDGAVRSCGILRAIDRLFDAEPEGRLAGKKLTSRGWLCRVPGRHLKGILMGLKTFLGLKRRLIQLPTLERTDPHCNICGGVSFREMNGRQNAYCNTCGSFERTRLMKLYLDRARMPQKGMKVLHLAPERGLANYIKGIVGDENYLATDIDVETYKNLKVTYMDLVTDSEKLPTNHFDLIVHSHVIEHVPCNITAVLFHLHRSLTKSGLHLFSIPILDGCYEESLFPLSDEERNRRFLQYDHVRRFGIDDIHKSVGMIFHLPLTSDITSEFSKEILDLYNVDERSRRGYLHGVFSLQKSDLLLKP